MNDAVLNLVRGVRFPEYRREHDSAGSSLRVLTGRLRQAYYDAAPMREDVYTTPFGGPIGDSIGPWPEFVLRGLPCQKSKQGYCTPCFYSRMPQVSSSVEKVYESLIDQVAYILHNFDGLVVRNQFGPVAWPGRAARKPVAFVLTPTGSFFDKIEFPLHVRNRILEMLLDHSRRIDCPFAVYIETHAEHFLSASKHREFAKTTSLLKKLNARVLFGYESSNPFVRNVLYNKSLKQQTFLTAVNRARDAGLGVGAFAFVGVSPLNDIEILCDAIETLGFLQSRRIAPVVMFPNVQPYTIQELLFLYHALNLPEPRTILEVVRHLITALPDCDDGTMDPWLIADPGGGPPSPKYTIFANRGACVTCAECTRLIYRALVELRLTRDRRAFLTTDELLSTCQCATDYHELLRKQAGDTPALEQRMNRMIETVRDKVDDYVSVMRPELNNLDNYAAFQDSVPRHGEPDEPAAQLKAGLL